ncbi:MAG: SLC13 family permease [bacterium]|nr:anion permease [Betaproteobacteria bacterium]
MSGTPTTAAPVPAPTGARASTRSVAIAAIAAVVSLVLVLAPAPEGLPEAGKRVIAVAVLVIALWCTEVIPAALTSLVVVVALVLAGAVPGFPQALAGFADPVAYFLVGVLTIGLAVSHSGLADRVARFFLRRSRGSARSLFIQLLLGFPLMTLLLPSATTRTSILVHVYEEALLLGQVPKRHPLSRSIMMALNSINRLASTIILTGGISPIVAAALIGGIDWSRWLLLMSVPYLALLSIGSLLIWLQYRKGFDIVLEPAPPSTPRPLSGAERRTVAITAGASLLWLTDSLHHLHPVAPAMIAWILLLSPRIGVITWGDFERRIGWSNFFVIASSLSLARALIDSGASGWIAGLIAGAVPQFASQPVLVIMILMAASVPVRILIPNITGFLATTIPIAMSIGIATGVNPLVCGLAVMIAGDAVLYYPAQSASSLAVYERGYLTAGEIFRFGVYMTLVAFVVVVLVALPYWAAVGEPLRMP